MRGAEERTARSGGGAEDVVVVQCCIRSRIPSSIRKDWVGISVAGAVPREPNGVRTFEELPLRSCEEGAKMDLLEPGEPWQEVLCVRRCYGENQFCLFLFLLYDCILLLFSEMVWSCAFEQHGGCGYMEWHDDPLPKFFSDLIGDLRDEVWRLKGSAAVGRCEESAMLAPTEDERRESSIKNAEIAEIRAKYQNVVCVFVIFVLGLVACKYLMQ